MDRIGENMTRDEKIQDIAIHYLGLGKSRQENEFTMIAALHPRIAPHFSLEVGELVIISAFYSEESWYVFTTRRIASYYEGKFRSLDPSRGLEDDFGLDFKGERLEWDEDAEDWKKIHLAERQIATIKEKNSDAVLRFEYKTGEEAMLPIWAVRYWAIKHPALDKLMTSAEREEFARRRSEGR